jgi:ankyrin repeat protein
MGIDAQYHWEAIAALKWLAFSEQPLSIEELAEAVVINLKADPPFAPEERLREPHDILQILSSLVTVSTTRKIHNRNVWRLYEEIEEIKLAHYSVKEYLISDRIKPKLASTFCMTHITAHRYIAESCLLYIMSYDYIENKSNSDEDLEDFPLLEYACRFWHTHARASQHKMKLSFCDLVFKLFVSDSWLSTWLRVYHPEKPWFCPFSKWVYGFGSPLYYASYLGLYCVLTKLIDSGVDVNVQGGDFDTALQAASIAGHEQIVQRLLEGGADVNAFGGHFGTALQAASNAGHAQIVQRLLEQGAYANMQGGRFSTALMEASSGGHEQIVQRLLEGGANVNAFGGNFGTALQAASIAGHEQIVQRLLEGGANVNAFGGDFGTALQAASKAGHEQIVQRLLKGGANVNAFGGHSGTALQAASNAGHVQIVQWLLEWGADANMRDEYFGTALLEASSGGHSKIVQLLLENRADVNIQEGQFNTALQAASYEGHDQIVHLLLEAGADVDAFGGQYGTPLESASYRGHNHIVKQLLKKGADINLRTDWVDYEFRRITDEDDLRRNYGLDPLSANRKRVDPEARIAEEVPPVFPRDPNDNFYLPIERFSHKTSGNHRRKVASPAWGNRVRSVPPNATLRTMGFNG